MDLADFEQELEQELEHIARARMEQEEAERAEREANEREEVQVLFEQERERLQELKDNGHDDDRVKVVSHEDIVIPYDKINFELVGGKTVLEVMQEQNERDRKSADRNMNRRKPRKKRRR